MTCCFAFALALLTCGSRSAGQAKSPGLPEPRCAQGRGGRPRAVPAAARSQGRALLIRVRSDLAAFP
eukprot:15430563-Alexandrium_andersonii.AAC.1